MKCLLCKSRPTTKNMKTCSEHHHSLKNDNKFGNRSDKICLVQNCYNRNFGNSCFCKHHHEACNLHTGLITDYADKLD